MVSDDTGPTGGSISGDTDHSISERTSSGEPDLLEDINAVFVHPISLQGPCPDFEDEIDVSFASY